MRRMLAIILCALLLTPLAVRAEEVQAPEKAAAGEIGRGLLSPKADVRAKAQARLLERIRAGGDLGAFVKAMSDAVAEWADRNERLMEVWLHQAVHGNAEEREQAVKLLAALGAPAIRRLSLELRHLIQHDGGAPVAPDAAPPAEEPAPGASAAEQAAANKSPVLPQLYKLGDLLERGMNALELRGLLQKAADAVEVKQLGTSFIVTASREGHEALLARLHELRKSAQQLDALRDGSKSDPEKSDGAGGDERPRAAEPQKPPAPPKGDPGPAPAAPKEGAESDAPPLFGSWRIDPVMVHLSSGAWTRAYAKKRPGTGKQRGLPTVTTIGGIGVHVGTVRESAGWAHAVRRIPDARSDDLGALEGIALGTAANFFSGKQIRYSGDVERTKGGAWGLVTKTIPHGIGLDVRLTQEDARLRVHLTATRTEVGLPIPVVRVKPSENAAPVELERPEWSTTRARAAFYLAPEGGGAFVALDGLATDDERLVLVLTVLPAMPDPGAAAAKAAR